MGSALVQIVALTTTNNVATRGVPYEFINEVSIATPCDGSWKVFVSCSTVDHDTDAMNDHGLGWTTGCQV